MIPKTPWVNHGSGDIIDADGRDVCAVYPRLDMSDDDIADRICAAVNAERQRNELAAALQRISNGQEMTGVFTHADTVLRYQEIARAALDIIEGRT
jgi:hypothetical protein